MDDLLPCTAGGTPAFGSAARRQLWVPLVEKACAKVHGCYEALEGGTIEEVPRASLLAIFTGYTTYYLLLTTHDLLLTTYYSLPTSHYLLQALGLLTGFPTERLALQGPEQPAAARYAASSDNNADEVDRDVLWSRLLSAHEAG